MNSHASYVNSAYSFLYSLTEEQIMQVGNLSSEGNPIPSFDEDLLIHLCHDAMEIFKKEENVIELSGDAIIVGDIHGSFHDLLRIIKYTDKCYSKVIFLGDYVDRGNFSLECITLLFALKILKPTTFYLLRGNHEFRDMCSNYGFKDEILDYHDPNKNSQTTNEIYEPIIEDELTTFLDSDQNEQKQNLPTENTFFENHININCYKYSKKLYNAFMEAFSYLPICAILNKTTICLHGGLTPLLEKVDDIQNNIKRPISNFNESLLLSDILWSDPSPKLKHMYDSNHRGKGRIFSGPVAVNFLKHNNLKRLVRGHEFVENGVEELFNSKCITVFSASSYCINSHNSSGILKIYEEDDLIEPIIFSPLKRLEKCDANYYKVQSFRSNLLQTSDFKNGHLLLSFHQVTASFDNMKVHYHTARKSENEKSHDIKNTQLNFKQKKRFSCIFNNPHILIPHVH